MNALVSWLRGAPPAPNPARNRDVESAVTSVLAQVPRTFLEDGYHSTIAVLLRGRERIAVALRWRDADEKERAFAALRARARAEGAEAAVVIMEGWHTPLAGGARAEALSAAVERRNVALAETFVWPIVRAGGKVRLGARAKYEAEPSSTVRVLPLDN